MKLDELTREHPLLQRWHSQKAMLTTCVKNRKLITMVLSETIPSILGGSEVGVGSLLFPSGDKETDISSGTY